MSCYTIKKIYFSKGLFDSFIDVTFVIIMKNSPRNNTIIKEINKYKPTKEVIIIYNHGFKNCEKKLYNKKIDKTYMDLLHANIYIFDRSIQYNNILVLEDDAKFSKDILNPKHIKNIEKFIKNNNFNTYSLGSLCIIGSMYGTHRRLLLKGGTHLIIFSKYFRNKIRKLQYSNSNIDDITSIPFNFNGYGYYKILVGQVFELTENSKYWYLLNIPVNRFQPIIYFFTKNNPIKGINNFNIIIKIITVIIIIIFIKIVIKNRKHIKNY